MNEKQKKARAKWFAGGRVTVGTISNIRHGNFLTFYVGKLRGKIISTKRGYKFKTREQACNNARHFQTHCRNLSQ